MMMGQTISLTVNGTLVDTYLAKAPDPAAPGVLVMHAWWGLTPFFKTLCDRLAAAGFTAFAANLYGDKTAATIDEAKTLMQQSDSEQLGDTAVAALSELRRHVPQGKLGIIGFSMGAAWAMVLAALRPDDVGAVTLFYGAAEADYARCKAAILGHFSPTDEWEDLECVQQMEAEMKAAGLSVTLHMYPGAGHWFLEEDRPDAYHAESARLAWDRTLAFMREHLI